VGKVLDALGKSPEADNTIVVFFGDHGLHLGEHGWWNKVTLFERATRVPLIVALPGAKGLGGSCRRPVELLSLYPTLAELLGLRAPAGLEGQSIAPLLRNPSVHWTRPAYTVVTRAGGILGRSIRNERFAYIAWDEGKSGTELYDHSVDPNEYRNVSGHAEYAAAESGMKKLLAAARPPRRTK
jgi:uncharacterized sulfatase